MFQLTLFDASQYGSLERSAAIDFFDGDRDKADAVIKSGECVFLPKVRSFDELGREVIRRFYSGDLHPKRFRWTDWDTDFHGRKECAITGGKFTRYGYFCLKNGRGILDC